MNPILNEESLIEIHAGGVQAQRMIVQQATTQRSVIISATSHTITSYYGSAKALPLAAVLKEMLHNEAHNCAEGDILPARLASREPQRNHADASNRVIYQARSKQVSETMANRARSPRTVSPGGNEVPQVLEVPTEADHRAAKASRSRTVAPFDEDRKQNATKETTGQWAVDGRTAQWALATVACFAGLAWAMLIAPGR